MYLGLPLNLNPGRAGMVVLAKGKDEELPTSKHIVYTLIFMTVSLLIVIFYPHILVILSLVGGIVVCTIGILIPGLLYYKMSKRPWYTPKNFAVVFISGVITLLGYTGALLSVL